MYVCSVQDTPQTQRHHSGELYVLVTISVVVAYVHAFVWLITAYLYSSAGICLGLLVVLALDVFAFILSIIVASTIGVVILVIIFVMHVLFIYIVRARIPFMVATVAIAARPMHIFRYNYLFFICATGISIGLGSAYINASSCVQGFVYFLLAVSYFWTVQVIMKVVYINRRYHVNVVFLLSTN